MNARYYEPETGRFLSQDSYTGNAYDPWTQHLYSYCGNNPTNMIDPTGHFFYIGKEQCANNTSAQVVATLAIKAYWDFSDGKDFDEDNKMLQREASLLGSVAVMSFSNGRQNDLPINKVNAIHRLAECSVIDDPHKVSEHAGNQLETLTGSYNARSSLSSGDISKLIDHYNSVNPTIRSINDWCWEHQELCKYILGAINTATYGALAYASMGGGRVNCFVAGTLISTEDGLKPIEEIEAGDYVWSEDSETGEVGLKQVVQTFVNEKDVLIRVSVNGNIIETTEGHRFWVKEKGWIDSEDLKYGDILCLQSGETAEVEDVDRVELDTPVKVYNFEVQDWHTYFVTEDGVLVHNEGCGGPENINNLRKLSKSEIDQLGGEQYTYMVKKGFGGSKADLYVDKTTGYVYPMNKQSGIVGDYVDKLW